MRIDPMTLACLFLLTPLGAVETWQPWEAALTSTVSYGNPYRDVEVSVVHVGPGGQTIRGVGCWDGDQRFLLRAFFPMAGTWTWTTSASDTANSGLHGQSGAVTVSAGSSSNPLHQHGSIQASANGRYLEHADGTPFFWLGDTLWRSHDISLSDWRDYIDRQAGRGFTIIQLSPWTTWGGTATDTDANSPWIGTPFQKADPVFWKGLEAKIHYANQQGIIPMLTGLPDGTAPSNATDRHHWSRWLAGRLHHLQVVLSPSFDRSADSSWSDIAARIRAHDAVHLITQHTGTNDSNPDFYYDDPAMSFCMVQSGHRGGNYTTAVHHAWVTPKRYYDKVTSRRLPVINGEAFYEGDPSASSAALRGPREAPRHCAWYSVLAGSAGFTNGVLGLWDYGSTSQVVSPAVAIERGAHADMAVLGQVMRPLAWWRLVPQHQAVLDQSTDDRRRKLFARADDGSFGLAYIPDRTNSDNQVIRLDLTGFSGPLTATWIDPVSGAQTSAGSGIGISSSHAFALPSSGSKDRVLHLAAGGGTPNTAPVISSISASPDPVSGSGTTLSASASDADGDALSYAWVTTAKPAGAKVQIGSGASPTVTFDRAGGYTFQVTVTDGRGGSAQAAVPVSVDQTATSIDISP